MVIRKTETHQTEHENYEHMSPSDQVRNYLLRAGLSQRQGARELGVDERTMRYWCSGNVTPPRMGIMALAHLVERTRTLRDEPAPYGDPAAPTYLAVEARVWWNPKDETVHVVLKGDAEGDLITTVSDRADTARGHKHLFGHLARLLRQSGRPAPEIG